MASREGLHYFVLFIDDFSRLIDDFCRRCWVYTMRQN